MTTGHRRRWSDRRWLGVAAAAAVVVFAAVVGLVLAYDAANPPSSVTAPPSPTPSQPAPDALLQEAAAALRAAPSAHVAGTVGSGSGAVRVDLAITSHGDATGNVVVGRAPVDVVRTGGRTYLRSQALVRRLAGSVVASYVGDKWVAVSTRMLAGIGIEQAIDRATSLDGIAGLVDSNRAMARLAGTPTIGGQRAYEVATGPTTVDVARDGTPYPLRVDAAGVLTLTLSGFGDPVVVQPPAGGVVDLGALSGSG